MSEVVTPDDQTSEDMAGIAKAGTLLSVESGCYSDYGVMGFFVVLKTFTPKDELDAWRTAHPEQKSDYHFRDNEFLAQLLAKGLLLEIPYGKLHLSDYGSVDECRFEPVIPETPL